MGSVLLLLAGCVGVNDDPDDGSDSSPNPVELPEDCSALPSQSGVDAVSVDADLASVVANAQSGGVIVLDDGTYDLTSGEGLVIPPGVTVRSSSGDASAVILEGGYATGDLVTVGRGATLAEVTVSHSYGDAVAVYGSSNTRVYGVHVVDPGGRGVAILPEFGNYSDGATIGCVTVTRADECDVGIEGIQTDGSRVYGATIDAPGCDEPGIKFATGSRDTVIERSVVTTGGIVGVMLGDNDYGEGDERVYDGGACPDRTLVGHYGGAVRNVFAIGGGIRVEDACGGTIAHTSVWGGDLAWAFSEDLVLANNLASLSDGGGGTASGNLTPTESDFVSGTDLHLAEGSAAIDAGTAVEGVEVDIDGEARDFSPDVGADEF